MLLRTAQVLLLLALGGSGTDLQAKRAEAIAALQKIIPKVTGDQQAELLFRLGALYEEQGEPASAAQAYRSILGEHASSPRAADAKAKLESLSPAERKGPGDDDLAAVKARAMKAYRAGDFAQACGAFRRVTELTPKEGAAWADLGLCLFKLGGSAAAASRRAVQLGDAAVRKNAYLDLGTFGKTLEPDEWESLSEDEVACAELEGPDDCARSYWACRYVWKSGSAAREETSQEKAVSSSRERAEAFARSVAAARDRGGPKPVASPEIAIITNRASTSYRTGKVSTLQWSPGWRLVHADACRGLLGLFCWGAGGTGVAQERPGPR